jgi:hypothetical protein
MSRNTSNTKTRTVAIDTVRFIDAFCRRNLTDEEILCISDLLDIVWDSPHYDRNHSRMTNVSRLVTAAAAKSARSSETS